MTTITSSPLVELIVKFRQNGFHVVARVATFEAYMRDFTLPLDPIEVQAWDVFSQQAPRTDEWVGETDDDHYMGTIFWVKDAFVFCMNGEELPRYSDRGEFARRIAKDSGCEIAVYDW